MVWCTSLNPLDRGYVFYDSFPHYHPFAFRNVDGVPSLIEEILILTSFFGMQSFSHPALPSAVTPSEQMGRGQRDVVATLVDQPLLLGQSFLAFAMNVFRNFV